MDRLTGCLAEYARTVTDLAGSPSATEATYYPALQSLLNGLLRETSLPFEVRTNTSQRRAGGGTDLPDLAFYDGSGDFVVVLGEVKTPKEDLDILAMSTDRQDQIGRYLAQTGVVVLTNVRAFRLLAIKTGYSEQGPIPPEQRELMEEVELWPSASALKKGADLPPDAAADLAKLLETAVTEFAAIAEPESLARILARQARRAKAGLPDNFSQAVRPLLEDFSKALGVHFEGSEGEEFLRSSLIQTAFYGLFAAWTLWHHSGRSRTFCWQDLSDYLKIPFLGSLFHEFRHPLRLKELGLALHLDRSEATLARVVPERFFARFQMPHLPTDRESANTSASTAILYFYEPFLEAFDPELRKQLGVWYTPQEIVRYQVRRADRLLRDELNCPRGFADERVVVLDPCCGTGAYLIEVVRCLAQELESEGAGAALAAKLLDAVCRRIIGFEILTAPFVIAQLQLFLILSDLGVEPDESHRPAVFLTNALTGWEDPVQLKLQFPELQLEHDAARRIKQEAPIIVILGNPPYNRFAGVPVDEEAVLVDHYKGIRRDKKGRQVGKSELFQRFGVRKHLLDDLYVRFFRLAETRIGVRAEHGIVTFISNYSFLTGRSHPLLRESLLHNFDTIWIDSLNGDKYRTGKIIPAGIPGAGSSDQSVFSTEQDPRGIQVGVGITTLLKRQLRTSRTSLAEVYFRDFWGLSAAKRQALLESSESKVAPDIDLCRPPELPDGLSEYQRVTPDLSSGWKFVPITAVGGYDDWPALDDLFPNRFQGVNPARGLDGSLVDTNRTTLQTRMQDYYSEIPFDELRRHHPELCRARARYEPTTTRKYLVGNSKFKMEHVVQYQLFPLDLRFLYYETEAKLLTERSPRLWENLPDNVFLVAVPQPRRVSESRPLFSSNLFDYHLHDRGSFGFPVHIQPKARVRDLFTLEDADAQAPSANLALPAWSVFRSQWQLNGELTDASAKDLVRQLFHFTLAVAHAPSYEDDHKESLAQDWLRLPIPRDRRTFNEIAFLGESIAVLLDPLAAPSAALNGLLGSVRRTLAVPTTSDAKMLREDDLLVTISHFGAARGGWRERGRRPTETILLELGQVSGDLHLNDHVCLANVPERVWRYELGGYPVIKKWLGYRDAVRRKGRGLTMDELEHLRSIIHRIAALLVLHQKLDEAYERAIKDPFTAEDLGVG